MGGLFDLKSKFNEGIMYNYSKEMYTNGAKLTNLKEDKTRTSLMSKLISSRDAYTSLNTNGMQERSEYPRKMVNFEKGKTKRIRREGRGVLSPHITITIYDP